MTDGEQTLAEKLKPLGDLAENCNTPVTDFHGIFEVLVAQHLGFNFRKGYTTRDGMDLNGNHLEVKLRTSYNGNFLFNGLRQNQPADVFVLSGYYEREFQFFVLPGYVLNDQDMYSILARPTKYPNREDSQRRKKWLANPKKLHAAVRAAVLDHHETMIFH